MQQREDYARDESEAHRLDRNWSELVQEFRVLGTGIQILFAFLLSIAFQARFGQTSAFEKAIYIATLLSTGLAVVLMVAPVAFHRLLFQERVKDELVAISNALAIAGLYVLALAMTGAVLLVTDWVGGAVVAAISTASALLAVTTLWLVGPLILRRRVQRARAPREVGSRSG